MDEKKKQKAKKKLLKNVVSLNDNLDFCKDVGFLDSGESLYNQLVSLEQEIHGSEDPIKLEEFSYLAKNVESQLEFFLDNLGHNTSSLDWPMFSDEE